MHAPEWLLHPHERGEIDEINAHFKRAIPFGCKRMGPTKPYPPPALKIGKAGCSDREDAAIELKQSYSIHLYGKRNYTLTQSVNHTGNAGLTLIGWPGKLNRGE